MPIYEFACPNCRVIFNFLSKRINPERHPTCPKCGNKRMVKQLSPFASPRGAKEPAAGLGPEDGGESMRRLGIRQEVRLIAKIVDDPDRSHRVVDEVGRALPDLALDQDVHHERSHRDQHDRAEGGDRGPGPRKRERHGVSKRHMCLYRRGASVRVK